MNLSERQTEILASLRACDRWVSPSEIGGVRNSDHSPVLISLFHQGYVERRPRSETWRVRPSWLYRASPVGAGLAGATSELSNHKTCSRCGGSKLLDVFGRSTAAVDGYRSACLACETHDGSRRRSARRLKELGEFESLPGEKWQPVPSFEDRYHVSNLGRVRSRALAVRESPPELEWRLLRQTADRRGYPYVCLARGGKSKRWYIHRLVLLSFVGPQPERHEAAHLNGRSDDPRLENLKWATHAENMEHARIHGTMPVGEKSKKSKLTDAAVRDMRDLAGSGVAICQLAARFSVDRGTVRRIVSGQGWRHLL